MNQKLKTFEGKYIYYNQSLYKVEDILPSDIKNRPNE